MAKNVYLSRRDKTIRGFAAKNRRRMTQSEINLQIVLSEVLPRYNLIFYNQHVAGKFILDFAIPKKRIAIEVDGIYHFFNGKKDTVRERILQKRGWNILRFTNYEVDTNVAAVIVTILGACGCDSQNLFQ